MNIGVSGWVGFNAFIAAMLLLDLFVLQREAHAPGLREAAIWSGLWIALALLFGAGVYRLGGAQAGLEFLTGYVIEKSLSLDNIFVILLIFTSFGVPPRYQHRVLFWGVTGALAMRGLFITVGTLVLERWHWVIYIFGALLLFTAIRTVLKNDTEPDPSRIPLVRIARRLVPMSAGYRGQRFLVREGGSWLATPLLLVLVLVEASDLLFAVDSIPAVLAISTDPFIVYTSNAFAVLGLRSLYLLLAAVMPRIRYLKYGIASILLFVAIKMLLMDIYEIPTMISLLVVAGPITTAVLASIRSASESGDAQCGPPKERAELTGISVQSASSSSRAGAPT